MMMDQAWDIVGFGVAAVDDVLTARRIPSPNMKEKLLASHRYGGGQTSTALVAAARLGIRCFYGGHFGDNELSKFIRTIYQREGIGYRTEIDFPHASPTYAVVIIDATNGERSILWTHNDVIPPHVGDSEMRLIASAKCLLVDQNFPDCQVKAAKVALDNGVSVVGDFERVEGSHGAELFTLTNYLIIPLVLAKNFLGVQSPEKAVEKMMSEPGRRLACVTDGENGAWYAVPDDHGAIIHQPAFVMPEVVDTNGCGDVFHGAFAASLVAGHDIHECIHRASAAAAMKTRMVGGQTATPTLAELEEFMARR